ncbi:MAG TPA: hypothetical protein VGW75_05030 [Solirubrobacteraceae bacterium]|jgi:hypothetical protein|nr:hypothetical protein [Solirubrobacteraceae bacterium]
MLAVALTFALASSATGQDPYDAVLQAQDATDCVIEIVEPHACPVGDNRERLRDQVESATDGPASAASAIVESGPPTSACVDDVRQRSNVVACAGGGGRSADGRTYYKGTGPPDYHCEYQGSWVESTNHRFPKGVYNSQRVCGTGMHAHIGCVTRDGYYERDCHAEGWRNDQELLSISFSARYRKFYCTNEGTPSHTRCAYDWVN